MDIKEIRRRIGLIKKFVEYNDYEAAHAEEDHLYRDVLMAIDNDLAREVLKTQRIKFARYTA